MGERLEPDSDSKFGEKALKTMLQCPKLA